MHGFSSHSYQAAVGVYCGLQLALLVQATASSGSRTTATIAATILSLLSALSLVILSHFEHFRSIRPSFAISVFLIATLLFDAARVRTQWLRGLDPAVAGTLTASLAVKCLVLVLESIEKRDILLCGLSCRLSLESTSGLIGRGSFWWLNSLLLSGFRTVLTLNDLPVIYEKLESANLEARIRSTWDNCKDQRAKHALAWASVLSLKWDILVIFIPKLCHAALSISQVYLIQDAVQFVQGAESESTGYGLLGGFAAVYVGLAVSRTEIRSFTCRFHLDIRR